MIEMRMPRRIERQLPSVVQFEPHRAVRLDLLDHSEFTVRNSHLARGCCELDTLAALYAFILFCGFILFGAVMWSTVFTALQSWKDRTLRLRSDRVHLLLTSLSQWRADMIAPRLEELASNLPEGNLIKIVGQGDHQLFPLRTPRDLPNIPYFTCAGAQFRTVRSGSGSYRQLCEPIQYENGPAFLLVSTSLTEDQLLLHSFSTTLFKVVPLVLLISTIGGYTLTRRALRPVASLIAEAKAIDASDLSRRLHVPPAADELRMLAVEWNALLSRIDTATGLISQFTADASHELRSPLAYIQAMADFHLHDPKLDRSARRGFQEIRDETSRTHHLLESLLTLARADAASTSFDAAHLRVDKAFAEVCKHVSPMASARKIKLCCDHSGQSAPDFAIHHSHFVRLTTIILDNAIKYTPEGGAVAVSYDIRDGLNFQVSDTGIGIAEEHLPRVFDRFYRVDTARTDAAEGVGLGLSIAKQIVDRYKGAISVESHVGSGTRVNVLFPASLAISSTRTQQI